MGLTKTERTLISPGSLIAVCDESGHRSSEPGENAGEDFSIVAVIFQGRRAFQNLKTLDIDLQRITGKSDYKYRQVRQSGVAREAVIRALDHQSGMIRLHGFYAEGGSFLRESERSLHAVQAMRSGEVEVRNAERKLAEIRESPGRVGLRDAIVNSLPAVAHWAKSRGQVADMYFDQRSDMPEFTRYLTDYLYAFRNAPEIFQTAGNLRWHAECRPELIPVSRIADVFAGDLRHTFRKKGQAVWSTLETDGFVGRHGELLRKAMRGENDDLPPILTKVGRIRNDIWDDDPLEGSTETTMFRAYSHFFIKRAISLFSPDGIGCHIQQNEDGFNVIQNPD